MINFIGGLWVETLQAGKSQGKLSGVDVAAHVTISTVQAVRDEGPVAVLSPDDADKLADALRAAATAARGRST